MEVQTEFTIRSPDSQQTVRADTHRCAAKQSTLGEPGEHVSVDGKGTLVRYMVTAHGHYRRQASYRYRGFGSES